MGERLDNKLWRALEPAHVARFAELGTERAKLLDDLAYKTSTELTKYLFTANTGAAAGMFILLRSGQLAALAFDLVLHVLFRHFLCGDGALRRGEPAQKLADGWTKDMNAWGAKRNDISGGGRQQPDAPRLSVRFWQGV